jgi:F-type H+-transporting ATPase subunit b
MPQFDVSTFSSQLFWLATCWVIVFVYLWKFLVPKMSSKLAERERKIGNILKEATNYDAQTEIMLLKYDEQLNRFKEQQNERLQKVSTFIQNSKDELEADLKQALNAEAKKLEADLHSAKLSILKQVPGELEGVLTHFIKSQLSESVFVEEKLKSILEEELLKAARHD